jgi:hypothetical protein
MVNILMPDYQTLLQQEAERRGWSEDQMMMFDQWRYNVAEVESNNDPIRLQGDDPKGYGRGKYQYEVSRGKGSGTNKTALNRLKKFLGRFDYELSALPKQDQKELLTKDPDFAKLSEDTQDLLFLADKSEAPETNLNALVNGNIDLDDAWIQWHWKGNKKEIPKKKSMWQRNTTPVEEITTSRDELLGTSDYLKTLF